MPDLSTIKRDGAHGWAKPPELLEFASDGMSDRNARRLAKKAAKKGSR